MMMREKRRGECFFFFSSGWTANPPFSFFSPGAAPHYPPLAPHTRPQTMPPALPPPNIGDGDAKPASPLHPHPPLSPSSGSPRPLAARATSVAQRLKRSWQEVQRKRLHRQGEREEGGGGGSG